MRTWGIEKNELGRNRGENNRRGILLERAKMGLGRNLVLEKSPGIHRNDPS